MDNNNKEISKMTLQKVKDGEGLIVKFKEPIDAGGAPASDDKDCKGLVHPDLKAAMNAMAIHWGLLSGLIKIAEVPDIALAEHPLLEKIHINGVSIGGNEGNQGVVLSGHYITWRGKAQQLNTPFERFEGAPESIYVYMDDLVAKIRVLDQEGHAYLSGEKRGAKPAPEPKVEDKNQGKLWDEKVTAEGNLLTGKDRDKYANKDAMARVAAMDDETSTGNKKSAKRTRRKSANTTNGPEHVEEEKTE